ncbi:hypothetical protein AYI70_g11931 [Smittium culicis]|uniref:SH3 domain-containing protein n=1 Tax=Smittium culicis TaxID=133412 RepID=A0A1R1WZP2_9FUNG|nr:hypothetical protein AYI70_g11931 [Smittium culicis]
MPLKGSKACPAYQDYVLSTDINHLFNWSPVDSVDAFDNALLAYVGGQQDSNEFQVFMGCTNYIPELSRPINNSTSNGNSINLNIIKYRRSVVCAQMIAGSENISKCYSNATATPNTDSTTQQNQQTNQKRDEPIIQRIPKPLCKSTCKVWVNSLFGLYNDNTLCTNPVGTTVAQVAEKLQSFCTFAPLNGEDDCISGDVNEINTCGFRTVSDWCNSCSYANEFKSNCASIDIKDNDKFFNGNLFGNSTISKNNNNSDKNEGNKSNGSNPNSTKNTNDHKKDVSNADDQKPASKSSNSNSKEKTLVGFLVSTSLFALLLLIALIICLLELSNNNKKFSEKPNWMRRFGESKFGFNPNLFSFKNTRTNKKDKNDNESPDFVDFFLSNVGKSRKVTSPFIAKREDEITLSTGDSVMVQIAFDDGWAVGKNLNTGQEGSFPMMCIVSSLPKQLNQNQSDFESIKLCNEYNKFSTISKSKTLDFDSSNFSTEKSFSDNHSEASTEISDSDHVLDLQAFRISRKSSIKSSAPTKRSSNTRSSMISTNNFLSNNRNDDYNQLDDYPNYNSLIEIPSDIHSFGRLHAPLMFPSNNNSPGLGFVPGESGRYASSYNNGSTDSNIIVLPEPSRTTRY